MSAFGTSCSLAETVKGRGGEREEGRRGGREEGWEGGSEEGETE